MNSLNINHSPASTGRGTSYARYRDTRGQEVTITFSQPIEDFFIALVSWNRNTVEFNTPIEIVSFGPGFWGNGTPLLNAAGDGFFGQGEVHGVIQVPGEFSSITFTHTTENWHGLTFGVLGLSNPGPDPN